VLLAPASCLPPCVQPAALLRLSQRGAGGDGTAQGFSSSSPSCPILNCLTRPPGWTSSSSLPSQAPSASMWGAHRNAPRHVAGSEEGALPREQCPHLRWDRHRSTGFRRSYTRSGTERRRPWASVVAQRPTASQFRIRQSSAISSRQGVRAVPPSALILHTHSTAGKSSASHRDPRCLICLVVEVGRVVHQVTAQAIRAISICSARTRERHNAAMLHTNLGDTRMCTGRAC